MDKLWNLKFTPIPLVPNAYMQGWFDSEEKAAAVLARYKELLGQNTRQRVEVLTFDDLIGHHVMRVEAFPYCIMAEVGPCDMTMMEVNKKVEASHRAAGFLKEPGFVGFEVKNDKETK